MAGRQLTREQVEARQQKAVQFTEQVRDDPERAGEIADMSIEEYAQQRGFKLINPNRRRITLMPKSRTELIQENRELKEQLADLEDRLDQIADLSVEEEEEEPAGEE
jgi:ribosomal protein L29